MTFLGPTYPVARDFTAFKSRIHLSMLYKKLNLGSSVCLYKIFIERTQAEQERLGPEGLTIKEERDTSFRSKTI